MFHLCSERASCSQPNDNSSSEVIYFSRQFANRFRIVFFYLHFVSMRKRFAKVALTMLLAFDLRQATTTTAGRRRNSFKGFNDLFLLKSSGRQRQWNETSINHSKALSSKARSVKKKRHFSPSSTRPAAKPKPFAICFCANLIYERFFFFPRLSSNCDELFRWEVKWFWHVAPLWRTTLWKN